MKYKLVALIILDGWGIRRMKHGNAVVQASTPNYDKWLECFERSILDASGEAVGLAAGQMGNSEVGHLNLGAGYAVCQDITQIDRSIADRTLYHHPDLVESIEKVKQRSAKFHLIGLLGPGGVHSHSRHLFTLVDFAQKHQVQPVIHIITDGRDTPPHSAIEFIGELEDFLDDESKGIIASVSGRYYAMDRDNRWKRTEQAYNAIALHQGNVARSAYQVVSQSYADGITDEFIVPAVINDARQVNLRVETGDCLLFFNFRADRMRQIVKAFACKDFSGFERPSFIEGTDLITVTEYEDSFPAKVLFPQGQISAPLARIISDHQIRQFHAAETEKYAHVTYFFNGRQEQPFDGEDRLLIPSPKVATYDLKPEMSAYELTEKVEGRLKTHNDGFMVINFANVDMVGHTGVLGAAIKAVETVDECAGRLVDAINRKGGVTIVTADHGNAERMINELTGEAHTYHTTSPVSCFIIGDSYLGLRPRGILADVAPTVLDLLGLPQPPEMTGRSLIETG